ncbi:MAG TPA: hypothetical protein EYP59_20820 [Thiotrichaceae bacterium]|nr:hypothetical protein [Thiotrichaceae bacterium]
MIRKHHNSEDNQKSYALLIWFLEFYGKKTDYVPYITDGPDDSSCDIIFDAKDSRNQTIYYVIQSKWNTPKNVAKNIGSQVGWVSRRHSNLSLFLSTRRLVSYLK